MSIRPVLVALLLGAWTGSVQATVTRPLGLPGMVAASDRIVFGRITERQSRWGPGERFIVTDYRLAPTEVLLDRTGPADAPELQFTLWGGTIGSTTDRIAGERPPEPGEDLVLFLTASRGPSLPVGGPAGLMTVTQRPPGARLVRNGAAGAVGAIPGGSISGFVGDRPLEETLAAIRAAVRADGAGPRERAASPQHPDRIRMADGTERPLPHLAPDPPGGTPARGTAVLPQRPPAADTARPDPADAGPAPATGTARFETDGSAPPPAVGPQELFGSVSAPSTAYGFADLPIVINQFPSSVIWSPADQWQMSRWNFYADVFRASDSPTGTYGWGNDRFDLAGWLTGPEAEAAYGFDWTPGVLALTVTRTVDRRIVEADVILNADTGLNWTLDNAAVQSGARLLPFEAVLLHELGHVWGAEHVWDRLAIMNYGPLWWLGFPVLYADDAAGIRAVYPAAAQPRNDFGATLYRLAGYQDMAWSDLPVHADAGGEMLVSGLTVDNTGTVSGPARIGFSLSPDRTWGKAILVDEITTAPIPSGISLVESWSVAIPRSVPGGYYFVGIAPRDGQGNPDDNPDNDGGFSGFPVQVIPALTGAAGADPESGTAPLRVRFTATATGGTAPYSFRWIFGDTTASSEPSVTHFYKAGVYTVSLTVTDAASRKDTVTRTVTVNPPPPEVRTVKPSLKKELLRVGGRNFAPGAVIRVNDTQADATSFAGSRKLVASVPGLGALLAGPDPLRITVVNPDGDESGPYLLSP